MINHLKEVHRELYLPQSTDSVKFPFKVKPMDEPYLYTDPNLHVDISDDSRQLVKVIVSNVGGGTLQVERVQIPRAFGKWVKRGKKPTPAALTPTSEPLEIELQLARKALPNPSTINVAELKLISNSRKKTFSQVLLRVHPSDDQSPALKVPEYVNFAEIAVWNVSITDSRKDETTQTVDFSLIGNFRHNPPTQLEVTQKDAFSFDACFRSQAGKQHYNLDMRTPGVVMPRQKKAGIKLKSFQQTVSVTNRSTDKFSEAMRADTDWLIAPNKVNVSPYDTTNFPISVNVEKLKQGRNFGKLVVSDKKIPVWAWYETVGQTTLTLDQDQSNFHDIQEFPPQGKPLPIEIVTRQALYQSFMIFEDVHFQFPLAEQDHTGYLVGDFNQWTPRTLLLDKRDDGFGVTLSLLDGTYRFRAEIDGEMRLDPSRLHEIICCSHGLASRIQIKRHERNITLRNRSEQRLRLRLQSSMEWMQVSTDPILLPSKGQRDVPVVFVPNALQLGLNLGWLEVESLGKSKRSHRAPILVMGMTNGAVPVLRSSEIEFPKFEQGKPVDIPLVLDIFGDGELKGEIQPSTVLRFAEGDLHVQNETAYESAEHAPRVHVLSDKPSNAYRKQCDAWLVTDCYLANRRLLPFTARYDMTHMVSDPPALYFPKVFLFDEPQQAGVTVRRSDAKRVDVTVEIPEELAQSGFLSAKKGKTDQYEFVLDPRSVTAAGHFSGNLGLKDEKSGMTLPLKFGANIIGSHADIQIGSLTQRSHQSAGIPVVITNVGETEMKIFEVRFKRGNFYSIPYLPPNLTLLAGESLNFHATVKKRAGFFRKIEDTLVIRLNDPQFSQGRFEKKITAEIQGIF